ncbi:MAG: RNA pseudouridine synthase, partial [Betaproteobacteria bacterium]
MTIPDECAGLRLDQALARMLPAHSRSRIRAWIDAGAVTIAGNVGHAKQRVAGGERVRAIPQPDPRAATLEPQSIPLTIVYEDDALIVIDKPAGLVVHPGSGNWSGTLANALLHHAPAL